MMHEHRLTSIHEAFTRAYEILRGRGIKNVSVRLRQGRKQIGRWRPRGHYVPGRDFVLLDVVPDRDFVLLADGETWEEALGVLMARYPARRRPAVRTKSGGA